MIRRHTRREFLGFLAGLTTMAGCGSSDLAILGPSAQAEPPFQSLARRLSGPLIQPGQDGYLARALPWNLRYADVLPAGVAVCQSSNDVREALLWAKANDVPLAVRSGGHSFAGFSTTRGLLIDVSSLNRVDFDASTGLARVEGGVRNAGAREALRQVDAAITHGRCVGVGVAGLTLGGGIGFNMRRQGLTCDGLVETEIVTASGEILVCNASSNSDLFWACRGGGGGNFGINTSLTFQTFPVDRVAVFEITWATSAEEVLAGLVRWAPNTPEDLGLLVTIEITSDRQLRVYALGQYYGSTAELREILDPIYQIATPSVEKMSLERYWDGQAILSEEGRPEYLQESSSFAYDDLTNEALALVFESLRNWPGNIGSAAWNFFLTGGQVDQLERTETAYCHRGAHMLTSCSVNWNTALSANEEKANLSWLKEFHQRMGAFTSDESFQNFVDRAQPNYLRAYYGENLERLIEIKQRHDPSNLFRFAQSLPVA